MQEGVCFELKISDKTCNFLSAHRSPSQSQVMLNQATDFVKTKLALKEMQLKI